MCFGFVPASGSFISPDVPLCYESSAVVPDGARSELLFHKLAPAVFVTLAGGVLAML